MDSSRKRKAGADQGLNGASKRQKIPSESPESTTQAGLQLIDALRNAKDKTGRSITTLFRTLPDKRELPEYYQTIKLPIAIDTVESKLRRHAYPTLTTVESDFKRMVANAKLFNDDKSIVFADAERVRKLLSNWMKAHNPAYQDPDYSAFPTPLPGEDGANSAASPTPAAAVADTGERPKKPTITLSRGRKQSIPPEPVAPEAATDAVDFAGKTFQQAQEQIIQELIDYVDDDGNPSFLDFRNLPNRQLTHYYQTIKHPVSLSGVKKKVLGKHGRDAPTGITDFKTWDAFEDETSYIWRNAQSYNEDGSDLYNLAVELEEYFKTRLAAAKAKVEEPSSGPRLKLNARPKPMLHLGAKGSPAPSSTPGLGVDNDALSRQKQLVNAGVNGHQSPQLARPTTSRSESQTLAATDIARPSSVKASSPPVVKTEAVAPSPAPSAARLASTAPDAARASVPRTSMPPPARVPSASPHPLAQPILPVVPTYAPAPPTFIDNFSRTKPVSEALLANLNISSHPQLNHPKPFRLDIPPSADYTHQSLTVMLPSSQYYLQITPTISTQLSSGRQYKLFVTVNGVRLMASAKPLTNGEALAAPPGERKQVYDAPLNAGVNRIEVEIVAVTGRGGTLEVEKVSVFANLMRG